MAREALRQFDPCDEVLAVQAQHGSTDSFAEIVVRWQVPVVRYLRHRTASLEDAKDLAQDIFVRAYENLHRYQVQKGKFRAWLFTIVRRLSINHHRRRKQSRQPLVVAADLRYEPSHRMAMRKNRQQLWDVAAATLTESQWSGLWLYYVEQLSVEEVRHVLGSSRGAIKALLHRARRKLAGVLFQTTYGDDEQSFGLRENAVALVHGNSERSYDE